jgi:nucleoside-diphosphate-sugar epimerase
LHKLLADRPLVVHLAAQPGVLGSFGTGFNQYLQDNLLATQRLFEAAASAGCPRVVYASSSSVYGDADAYPCFEDSTPTRPRSPYGVTKQACEKLAEVYAGMGLPTVGMRFFTVYGPRQRPDMAIRRLCEAAAGGPRFTLRGDGSQVRDFTHVDDAVDATVRTLTAPDPAPVLNVGGGEEATMAEVIRRLELLAGRPVPVERQATQIGDVRRTAGDTTKARSLGWEPTVTLWNGLRSELHWVQERHEARVDDMAELACDINLIAGRAS